MKTKILSTVAIISLLGGSISLMASTAPQTAGLPVVSQNQFETIAFSDTAEAGMLRRSYWILNWADKDYRGHRAKAMSQIKEAARMLGLDLNAGGDRDREKQAWSDDRLHTAEDLLSNVLNAAEVKGQPRISRHVSAAINELNIALSVR